MPTAYEPPPLWDCQHIWMNVNLPFRSWISNSSDSECPESVPYEQKQQCTICGGFRTTLI